MDKIEAANLINQYITGWQQNDITKICSCLTDDCIIIESHGPTYHGVKEVTQWFTYWLVANSKVVYWYVNTHYFCEKDNTSCVEWDFSCISRNQKYAFNGMSVIKFKCSKICLINEYRMTKPASNWNKKELISE